MDATDIGTVKRAIQPNTKVIYIESPVNPTLKLVDIAACAEIANVHGVTSVIDNTFATPCGQQPISLGFDVVVHSMTKYLSGNSTVVAGVIVGSKEFIDRARKGALRNFGGVISPFNAWLTLHGVATLPLRFERHCANAHALAEFLENHSAIERVHYPGLPSHPQHALAKQQMNYFGGMISFELKGGVASGREIGESGRTLCTRSQLGRRADADLSPRFDDALAGLAGSTETRRNHRWVGQGFGRVGGSGRYYRRP